jgi:hypothetical protein
MEVTAWTDRVPRERLIAMLRERADWLEQRTRQAKPFREFRDWATVPP